MDFPEYLNFFKSSGGYRIRVRFKDVTKKIVELHMMPEEINRLINPETGDYFSKMYFDDCLCDVLKYEIDTNKKLLTIFARTRQV